MIPAELPSLVRVRIYSRSVTSQTTALEEPAEDPIESADWSAGFQKKGTKDEVLRNISNKCVLKAHFKQRFSDTPSASKIKAQDLLFQLLWYKGLIRRHFLASNVDLSKKKQGIT